MHHATDVLRSEGRAFEPRSLKGVSAMVGFDGFVDEMVTVVERRTPGGGIEPVPTIEAFGRLVCAAAGRSFGREIIVKRVEAGGNAPNLADGLIELGIDVDFYGTLGAPLDPVFEPFAKRCRSCTTLGACGRTLALEFGDGKLMLNNTGRLGELTGTVMEREVNRGALPRACRDAGVVGLANWSKYPHMTACWRVLTERVLSSVSHRPWVMVDLADPSARSATEIGELFDLLASLGRTCRVVLGANLAETGVLLRSAGLREPGGEGPQMATAAGELRTLAGVEIVAVHSQRRAAAAWGASPVWVEGQYNPAPIRTTGVGDRFNAGLCAGLVGGMSPAGALALGCVAGAWFVTRGRALAASDLPRVL